MFKKNKKSNAVSGFFLKPKKSHKKRNGAIVVLATLIGLGALGAKERDAQ